MNLGAVLLWAFGGLVTIAAGLTVHTAIRSRRAKRSSERLNHLDQ